MSVLRTLTASLVRSEASRREAARIGTRRAPSCESLEGRQLLNGTWEGPGLWLSGPAGAPTGTTPAHVYAFDKAGGPGAHHCPKDTALRHGGPGGHMPVLSAQVKADLQTLQTDEKALQAEVPADLTAKINADKAVIQNAFAALTPAQHKADHAGPRLIVSGGDPSAGFAAMLKSANVPAAQADAIVADFKTLKTTLDGLDPALHAKITADRAALAKDAGPGHHGEKLGAPDMNPMML